MKKTIIFILGLKRNGNHPMINWMIHNFRHNELSVCFVNDVNEKDLAKEYIESNIGLHDVTVLSYEEISVEEFNLVKHKTNYDVDEKYILILRDFPNSFASRKKYISDFKSDQINIHDYFMDDHEYKKQWINFAHVFLSRNPVHFVCLNFNKWFRSKEYRDYFLTKNFNLKNYDIDIQFVPKNAGGSSFDGVHFSGKASMMNVLERWQYYKDDQYFMDFVFRDEYVVNINNVLFQ